MSYFNLLSLKHWLNYANILHTYSTVSISIELMIRVFLCPFRDFGAETAETTGSTVIIII